MKKLTYILIIFFSITAFSQEKVKAEIQENLLSKINASPNPFTEKTTIFFNATSEENIGVIIQDLLGNTIFSDHIVTTEGRNSIPFYRNALSPGIYIYTLKTKNRTLSKRFVIK